MSSLFAFPGQGAQRPGMLHELPNEPVIQACMDEASEVLGESVLRMDSSEAFTSTRAVQLCLLVSGVACARLLLQRSAAPDHVAGLSIGAYPAAVIAGALDYADALRLVSLRGELMQQAYPTGYGMSAIVGLGLDAVEQLIKQAREAVYLANINADTQFVIAGSDEAMSQVAEAARVLGAGRVKRLAVSVPSHCRLLDQPARELSAAFASVSVKRPTIRYISSSSARVINDPEALRHDLAFNMCRVVDWFGTLRNAYERGVRLMVELPPGSVLSGLARRVFSQGTVVAFEGARIDTLEILLRQEVNLSR